MKNNLLSLAGAALGGAVGYYAFFWLVRQGLYGLILPGGLLGLGAGMFKPNSKLIAIITGISALILTLYADWRFEPFVKDESFGYFISHLRDLRTMTLLMMAAGTIIAFYIPFRRAQEAKRTPSTSS